jgi:hypothetical protein
MYLLVNCWRSGFATASRPTRVNDFFPVVKMLDEF